MTLVLKSQTNLQICCIFLLIFWYSLIQGYLCNVIYSIEITAIFSGLDRELIFSSIYLQGIATKKLKSKTKRKEQRAALKAERARLAAAQLLVNQANGLVSIL